MGDPKRQRKKYEAPRFPWSKTELSTELRLLGEYGLRNKRELWRHHHLISKYRTLARQLLAQPEDERAVLETQLINKLAFIRVIPENADLDDVLDLSVEQILARRLQTLVFKNGLARTPYQARQLIVHGHISIKERKVTVPSYLVSGNEEGNIQYTASSVFANSGLIQADGSGGE
ncbi:MAG: 30S ribosomal protein S4 [Candidatus Bathyarchaeota archaeon]|jgi:small subunit ribosomal protein S4|nr:30S ribosomal protein S4 [Candidatus Bathyarchaeota archaeon]